MNFSQALQSHPIVLADFVADWCEPCKWAEPVINEVIKKFEGQIVLHKIDIDQQADVARQHHILSVPTLVLFKNGKEVWRMRGFDTAPALIKTVSGFL